MSEATQSMTEMASTLELQMNTVQICRSLDEKGLTKSELYPLWIW